MKKSNTLMLAYIGILILTMVADAVSEWSGIDQVALAATVAGFFFALADYCAWEVSYVQPIVGVQKESLNACEQNLSEILECINRDKVDLHKQIALFQDYCDTNSKIEVWIDAANSYLLFADKANSVLKTNSPVKKRIIWRENTILISKIAEVFWATVGFFAFFTLAIFDKLVDQFLDMGSLVTIGAFTLIMMTYFLKDIGEGQTEKQVSENEEIIGIAAEIKTNCIELRSTLLEKAEAISAEIHDDQLIPV